MRLEQIGGATLVNEDCRVVAAAMPEESIDAIVCDPPYGLGFMGKGWDHGVPGVEFWRLLMRVAKPGAHLLAFGGTRTYHRLACAIEDAGWEIRDCIMWVYGSGFPKSHNGEWGGTALKPAHEPIILAQKPYTPQQQLAVLVPTIGELICKVASFEKTATPLYGLLRAAGFWNIGTSLSRHLGAILGHESKCTTETAHALTTDLRILKSSLLRLTQGTIIEGQNPISGDESDVLLVIAISRSVLAKCERLANTIAGEIAIDWLAEEGSAPAGGEISPAWEPIIVARKPLEGTVEQNVRRFGTGALNIDGCRVEYADAQDKASATPQGACTSKNSGAIGAEPDAGRDMSRVKFERPEQAGRWPANLIRDSSEEVLACFPEAPGQQGDLQHQNHRVPQGNAFGQYGPKLAHAARRDTGSAARFFYCAKASKKDRNEGCDTLPDREGGIRSETSGQHITRRDGGDPSPVKNGHPTVKPTDLMRYLCRLVTPKDGVVFDPFMGSGSTGKAALLEGFSFVGAEMDTEHGYFDIACARVRAAALGALH